MAADEHAFPATTTDRHPTATSPRDLVRSGAEVVELSERFYRGLFIGGLIFVGVASIAALAFLPLRESDAGYMTITVVTTALLVLVVPIAVWRASSLYRLLRRSQATRLAVVILAAALVAYPLRSELWWPSCALVMLVAILVPLRVALAYCLIVLLANLAAHAVAGDLNDTPPETIIGLWIGYVFWSSAFALFTERFAAHVLRLNATSTPVKLPPIHVDAVVDLGTVSMPFPAPMRDVSAQKSAGNSSDSPVAGAIHRLTAKQLQVIALLADGLRYVDVAACMAISERQVQRHVSDAVRRLGLRNSIELVAVAVSEGLVPRRE